MKLSISAILCAILLTVNAFGQSKHYFVGQTEVSESFWMSIPDSLRNGSGEFTTDTEIRKEIYLPYTHYLDTVSNPSIPIIKRHSPEKIAELEKFLIIRSSAQSKSSLRVQVGDAAPAIDLLNLLTGAVEENIIKPEKCYLISFWAIWCGNCLQELKPEGIPHVAKEFVDNPDFKFKTVCIDSPPKELREFFESDKGSKWAFLAPYTYMDPDRTANSKFAKSGEMPLNIVIDCEGRIAYIHSGALATPAQFEELSEAIRHSLE